MQRNVNNQEALNNALLSAVKRQNIQMILNLLHQGAKPADIICPSTGNNLLHFVAEWKKFAKYDIWDLLVQHGARLDVENKNKRRPFMELAASSWSQGHKDGLKWLIKKYNNDYLDSLGYGWILLNAINRSNQHTALLLLESGANPNMQYLVKANEYEGFSCLHFAVTRRLKNVISLLLYFGADKSIKNAAGQTAEEMAAMLGYRECEAAIANFDGQTGESVYKKLINANNSDIDYADIAEHKEAVLAYILRLPADERLTVLMMAKEKDHPLGELFWHQRGILWPSLERGTLKRIEKQREKDYLAVQAKELLLSATMPKQKFELPELKIPVLQTNSVSELVPVFIPNHPVQSSQEMEMQTFNRLMAQAPDVSHLPRLVGMFGNRAASSPLPNPPPQEGRGFYSDDSFQKRKLIFS